MFCFPANFHVNHTNLVTVNCASSILGLLKRENHGTTTKTRLQSQNVFILQLSELWMRRLSPCLTGYPIINHPSPPRTHRWGRFNSLQFELLIHPDSWGGMGWNETNSCSNLHQIHTCFNTRGPLLVCRKVLKSCNRNSTHSLMCSH